MYKNINLLNCVLVDALKIINDEISNVVFQLNEVGKSNYEIYSKYIDLKKKRNVIEGAIECIVLVIAHDNDIDSINLPEDLEKVIDSITNLEQKLYFDKYDELLNSFKKSEKLLDLRIERLIEEKKKYAPLLITSREYKLISDNCNELFSLYILMELYKKENPNFLQEKNLTPEAKLLKAIFGE